MSRWDKWEPFPPVMAPEMGWSASLSLSLSLFPLWENTWAFLSSVFSALALYLAHFLSLYFFNFHINFLLLFWPFVNHITAFLAMLTCWTFSGYDVQLTYCVIALSQKDYIRRPWTCGITSMTCFLEMYPRGWSIHVQKHIFTCEYSCLYGKMHIELGCMPRNFISEAHLAGGSAKCVISILPWAVFSLIVLIHSRCIHDNKMCIRNKGG